MQLCLLQFLFFLFFHMRVRIFYVCSTCACACLYCLFVSYLFSFFLLQSLFFWYIAFINLLVWNNACLSYQR